MKQIVLPGSGAPKTLCVSEDSTVGILSNGRLINVTLTANVPTRIIFANSLTQNFRIAA